MTIWKRRSSLEYSSKKISHRKTLLAAWSKVATFQLSSNHLNIFFCQTQNGTVVPFVRPAVVLYCRPTHSATMSRDRDLDDERRRRLRRRLRRRRRRRRPRTARTQGPILQRTISFEDQAFWVDSTSKVLNAMLPNSLLHALGDREHSSPQNCMVRLR